MDRSRSVRIFLSSTFRDFGEERDLLVRRVFPALRAKLKDRFVELVDVDLRWGITAEEAERGEVLPICLAEIDRSRPYFIGMLGERYGWIPPHEGYASDLLERQPWLKKHQGGKSVTELEILHGVLKNKRMKSRAFFYFRSPAYARAKGGHYVPDSTEDKQRQLDLKRRIKDSGYSVTGYRDPEALAKRMERDLWKLLDSEFPATDVPDAFERESMRHEAYAAPRRRLYLGGDTYIHALNALLKKNANRILITGQSGGGKSALLANALAKHRGAKTHLLEHYLGSSSDAADALALVRRVIEYIRRVTGSTDPVAADTEELFESVPDWLAIASAFAQKHKTRWIFVFDALNNLNGYRNLMWFPAYLPERIQIVVSSLEGEVKEALETKGNWDSLVVEPLEPKGQRQLLTEYLKRFNKSLPADLLNQALGHPLSNNPLWLKTLAEELRLFGSHEELSNRLNTLLGPPKGKDENEQPTVDDLFEHVLQRIEADQGRKLVRDALTAIWASRAGLSETELLEILAPHIAKTGKTKKANKLPPAQWAPVRNALDEMLLESGGRIIFGHDYVKVAVKDRYLPRESLQRNAHKKLAEHFAKLKVDERVAEELPHQWLMAKRWSRLRQCMTERQLFEVALSSRGAEELIAYWLRLQTHQEVEVSEAYRIAWLRWKPQDRTRQDGALAMDLSNWLQEAGYFTPFTVTLNRYAMEIARERNGARSLSVAMTTSNLATSVMRTGSMQEALRLHTQAVSLLDAKRVVNPETQTCRTNYALCLLQCGQVEAAQQILTKLAAAQSKSVGEDHPDTISTLMSLAIAHSMQGDQKAALEGFKTGLAATQSRYGRLHPATAGALSNLGIALKRSGDLSAAMASYEQALAIYKQSLGPDHPETLMVLNNQATLLRDAGDLHRAEVLYRQALAGCERTLGEGHPDTADTLSNLAVLLQMTGDREAAITCLRRALATLNNVYGASHPDTEWTAQRLAVLESQVTT